MINRIAIVLWSCLLIACEQKLPGPLVCETMSFQAIGRSPREAVHSPKVRRVTDRLIHGCLTVPFDQQSVSCVQAGRPLLPCLEALVRRAPEREQAVRDFLHELDQLDSRP